MLFDLQRFSQVKTIKNGEIITVNDNVVLTATPQQEDGALFVEIKNNIPYLKIKYGNYQYRYTYSAAVFTGDIDSSKSCFMNFEGDLDDTSGAVWRPVGDVSFDSDIKKFGTMSLHTPTSAYIETDDLFDLSSNKFTLDLWIYLPEGTTGRILSLAQTSPPIISGLGLYSDGFWFANSQGTGWNGGVKVTFVKDSWNHLAIVKNEVTWFFFLNGKLKGRNIIDNAPYMGNNFRLGGTLYISGSGDPAATNMYIDNFRFCDGIARWSEDFSVPDEDDY